MVDRPPICKRTAFNYDGSPKFLKAMEISNFPIKWLTLTLKDD